VLYIFVARYLSKKREVAPVTFKQSLIRTLVASIYYLGFILPANFSTTALIFSMVIMLTFVGNIH
jgi:cell division protein FtsW